MSTTQPRADVDVRECDRADCDEDYRTARGTGGYCSTRCWARATARRLIQGVHRDHQWCANCYRRLRTVSPPPPDWYFRGNQQVTKDACIGRAVPEYHTIRGTGERLTVTHRGDVVATEETARRQICSCGTTHHTTIERSTLSKSECLDHAARLGTAIQDRAERGTHSQEIDPQALRYAARRLKSKRDLAGDDALVFEGALAAVLRNGGPDAG